MSLYELQAQHQSLSCTDESSENTLGQHGSSLQTVLLYGCTGAAAAGRSSGGADDEAPFLSYGDEDVPNVLPRFDSSKVGFHFPGYLTRGSLEGAKDFFDLLFLMIT